MRLHRSEDLQNQWYHLPAEVRTFIESLKTNPYPGDAMAFPEEPGYYEEFISGYWFGWQVDDSGSETVIRVTMAE